MKVFENILSKEECDKLINISLENPNLWHKHANDDGSFKKRHILNLLNIWKNYDVTKKFVETLKEKEIFTKDKVIANFEIVYWYEIGESHCWHIDHPPFDFTTITFLNQNFTGGELIVDTTFFKPETGKLIFFDSKIKHAVTPLTRGDRFILATWFRNTDANISR
jgi:hypothetical protein